MENKATPALYVGVFKYFNSIVIINMIRLLYNWIRESLGKQIQESHICRISSKSQYDSIISQS